MCWRTTKEADIYEPWTFTEASAIKYYVRSIVIHLGLDIACLPGDGSAVDSAKMVAIQNLCNVMAGTKPMDLAVEVQTEENNVANYNFSLSDGSKLVALWIDNVATDGYQGVEAKIVLPKSTFSSIIGIDVLEGIKIELAL